MNAHNITGLLLLAYRGDADAQATVNQRFVDICSFQENLFLDVTTFENAIRHGRFDIRADPAKYSIEYKKIIDRINTLLDAVTGPLTTGIGYYAPLGRDLQLSKVSDARYVDMDRIKMNLHNTPGIFNSPGMETEGSARGTSEYEKTACTKNGNSNCSKLADGPAPMQGAPVSFVTNGEIPVLDETENSPVRAHTSGVISWGDRNYDIDEFRSLMLSGTGEIPGVGHDGTE